jgi:hypothetical protein
MLLGSGRKLTYVYLLGTWIREGDLDINNEGFPQQFTRSKNESVPSVHGGILWPDEANKLVYMYGGEFGNGKPEDFQQWYYDIVYDTWNISNASTTNIQRAAWGTLTLAAVVQVANLHRCRGSRSGQGDRVLLWRLAHKRVSSRLRLTNPSFEHAGL